MNFQTMKDVTTACQAFLIFILRWFEQLCFEFAEVLGKTKGIYKEFGERMSFDYNLLTL